MLLLHLAYSEEDLKFKAEIPPFPEPPNHKSQITMRASTKPTFSPPSDPAQRLFQETPVKSKFLAVAERKIWVPFGRKSVNFDLNYHHEANA